MSVDYYGALAAWRGFWPKLFNFIALFASSGAAISYFSKNQEYAWCIGLSALVATAASIVGVLNHWTERRADFLHAQARSRDAEIRWDRLWQKVNGYQYDDFSEVTDEYEALRREDAEIAGIAPHAYKEFLARRIQKRIQRSENIQAA